MTSNLDSAVEEATEQEVARLTGSSKGRQPFLPRVATLLSGVPRRLGLSAMAPRLDPI